MVDEARPILPREQTLEDFKLDYQKALRALRNENDTLLTAQEKRTAWEASHRDWSSTDGEIMALENLIQMRTDRCDQLEQQCQKALLRIKEKEANQRCQYNDLIDTEQLLKPFAKFWEFLASYARTSTSKAKLA
ncbi:unnamed protein product [Aphanomyces euteiches]|uniref:Uncharacterized protein n=1 Tax=Aphanomyces euteiches TaxID=100861 RepID=A0A6G0WBI4_9STRA|nr:hypothetical protein Ae201684_016630 [Aphanomyces euteiches]KAH9078880.1 hypothetical protein Ae201684P_019945 [Aphanomyces euteiches]KAH9131977.1 hypothetical protein AeRB84_021500 [Aphanomyces euteiches]